MLEYDRQGMLEYDRQEMLGLVGQVKQCGLWPVEQEPEVFL
jgi:hypothetical protein